MSKPAFVTVKWLDAWGDDDNFSTIHGIKTTHEAMPVETHGYLLVDDSEGVSIANEHSTQDGHDVYRGRTFIPRAMIQEVIEVTLRRKARKSPPTTEKAPSSPSPSSDSCCREV